MHERKMIDARPDTYISQESSLNDLTIPQKPIATLKPTKLYQAVSSQIHSPTRLLYSSSQTLLIHPYHRHEVCFSP